MNVQTAREIDEEAARWALQIESGDLDAPYSAELTAWLDGDPRRAGAFLRAQAALSFLDRGRALPAGASGGAGRPRLDRRVVLATGGAAALIACGLGAVAVLGDGRRYRTQFGEIRKASLADGSVIDINTDSIVDVALHSRGRNLNLRQGEAYFEVAKNPDRPFLVRAGDARFRAVGTAFSVRRLASHSELLVTEGLVEAWHEGDGGKSAMVSAGSRIDIGPGLPLHAVQAEKEIERTLAWRGGQISLDGETLAAAAAEFNRYNHRQLVIDDTALARRQFVGLFRVDDPGSFARAVAASTGAHLTEDPANIRLR